MRERHLLQWVSLSILFVVVIGGWWIPVLGWVVPIVMILALSVSIFYGRLFCGYFCPRGALYDRLITRISPKKNIPLFFRSMMFRWAFLLLLMGIMLAQLIVHVDQVSAWGRIFWTMCTVTTVIGIVLALSWHPRTWCAFCPIGTLSRVIGGRHSLLHLNTQVCTRCKKCEKVCPMNLTLMDQEQNGVIANRDCLQCRECIHACPRRALSP